MVGRQRTVSRFQHCVLQKTIPQFEIHFHDPRPARCLCFVQIGLAKGSHCPEPFNGMGKMSS